MRRADIEILIHARDITALNSRHQILSLLNARGQGILLDPLATSVWHACVLQTAMPIVKRQEKHMVFEPRIISLGGKVDSKLASTVHVLSDSTIACFIEIRRLFGRRVYVPLTATEHIDLRSRQIYRNPLRLL
jgi:hypothetical protein